MLFTCLFLSIVEESLIYETKKQWLGIVIMTASALQVQFVLVELLGHVLSALESWSVFFFFLNQHASSCLFPLF
jgi:hypothetical protein